MRGATHRRAHSLVAHAFEQDGSDPLQPVRQLRQALHDGAQRGAGDQGQAGGHLQLVQLLHQFLKSCSICHKCLAYSFKT